MKLRSAGASPLWKKVLEAGEELVLETLESGLLDAKSKYAPEQQDLMFFAAARTRKLGGAFPIARRLWDLGVPGNSVDTMQQTPLFFPAREGNLECAQFLIQQRCDVNHCDKHGQSALFYSAREGHIDVCKLLLSHGASWGRDKYGQTSLQYAKRKCAEALTQMTVDGHPNPRGRKAPIAASTRSRGDAMSTKVNPGAAPEVVLEPQLKRRRMSRNSNGQRETPIQRNGKFDTLGAWVAGARLGHVDSAPAKQTNLGDGEKFAEAGEYFVCTPSVADAPRLRELEREFVEDHFEIFREEPWNEGLQVSDWCRLVNVIEQEEPARQAIANIIFGKMSEHATLQCVHIPQAEATNLDPPETPPAPRIVGYVHMVRDSDGRLDIAHLKVERSHQQRGLGALLMAGAVRAAQRLAWEVRALQLVAVMKNAPALSLYRTLGFENLDSVQKPLRHGAAGVIGWQTMGRSLDGAAPATFARVAEARARTSMHRAIAAACGPRGD